MNFLKKSSLLIITITAILLNMEVRAEGLYSWKDKLGVMHYSSAMIPKEYPSMRKISNEIKTTEFQSRNNNGNSTGSSVYNAGIENAINGTFTIKNGKKIGTGFFISSKGYAITCHHVIKEGEDHTALLHNRAEYPIGIISANENYDLALIIVLAPANTPFLRIRNSGKLDPGEEIYTIKGSMKLKSEAIHGIYTGMTKKEDAENCLLQFSAQVNQGVSGGPLVDINGEVAGVVSWKIISKKGIPVSGEVFAVPSEYILEEYGKYLE